MFLLLKAFFLTFKIIKHTTKGFHYESFLWKRAIECEFHANFPFCSSMSRIYILILDICYRLVWRWILNESFDVLNSLKVCFCNSVEHVEGVRCVFKAYQSATSVPWGVDYRQCAPQLSHRTVITVNCFLLKRMEIH